MSRMKYAVGVMVGSSLDGMDMVGVRWNIKRPSIFVLEQSATVPLPQEWKQWIEHRCFTNISYCALHREEIRFSRWVARQIKAFVKEHHPEVIGFHGPTLYHDETGPISYQWGDGAFLYGDLAIPVVVDFRAVDQALGGAGAPILSYVEHLAFPDYDGTLNLGGIANISFAKGEHHGRDVVPCNQLLNRLAHERGAPYDCNGEWARQGKVNPSLLMDLQLIQCDWIAQSLDRKEIFEVYWPVLEHYKACPLGDRLRTVVEFIAQSIAQVVPPDARVLVTGGGVHHSFLMERVCALSSATFEIPDRQIVDYKEAMLIALMALLRLYQLPNTYLSYQAGLTAGALWGASGRSQKD